MARILVFNSVSLDGYFTDAHNDMSWAHKDPNDAEWNAFVGGNASGGASGGGALLLGRVTYEMMARFWPTPAAMQMMPEVAKGMNAMTKIVFSRSLKKAAWSNTRLMKGDLVAEVKKLKQGDQLFSRFPEIKTATIKVIKLYPPIGGQMKGVSVEMSRK